MKTKSELRREKYYKILKEAVEEGTNNEYKLLSKEYVNVRTKVKVLHTVCGHEYEVIPSSFKKGNRCPKCVLDKLRGTIEDLREIVELGTNNEYKLLSKEYVNVRTKVKVLHKKCGYEYEVIPSAFKKGNRCPKCARKIVANKLKGKIEDFRLVVELGTNNEYQLISKEYVNNYTKVKILHKECGFEYLVTPDNFKKGNRCPKCARKIVSNKLKGKIEDFRLVVELGTNNEYRLLSKEYVNAMTKVKVLHKKCGYEYLVTPSHFKSGNRCPKCFGTPKGTIEELREIVEDGTNNEYRLLSKEYVNNRTKVKVLHKKCGYEYGVTPSDFRTGYRCPNCKSSKGETTVKNILDNIGINYIKEYRIIKNPDTKYYLPIDFAIFNRGKLIGCIEYDGIQHYEVINHFGGESSYYKTVYKDYLRDCWCKSKNISLLRIPYWEKDIEGLVEKYVNNIKNEELYKKCIEYIHEGD